MCIQHCTADQCSATGHTAHRYVVPLQTSNCDRFTVSSESRFARIEITAYSSAGSEVRDIPINVIPCRLYFDEAFTSSALWVTIDGQISLSMLPTWAQNSLRLDELDLSTLQLFDAETDDTHIPWQPTVGGRFMVPESGGVLFRALTRDRFPGDFVVDMAAGLDAAAVRLANDLSADLAAVFADVFPRFKPACPSEFLSAVTLWEGLSPSLRARYCNTGRTQAGTWKALVAETQLGHRDT